MEAAAKATTHSFTAVVLTSPVSIKDLTETLAAKQSAIDPQAAISHQTEDGGLMYIFNFGATCFWNVGPEIRAKEIKRLMGPHSVRPAAMIVEEFTVVEGESPPHVEFSKLVLDRLTTERAEVIAATLSQSATMEMYEERLEEAWTTIDSFVATLASKGRLRPFSDSIHKKIGAALIMRNDVVRVLHLLDRPDLIWEDKVMDELYGDLRAMFDLAERFQALEYKLKLIQETLEVLLDVVRDRRLYWLEASIVILIVIDIVITLTEKFL